MNIEDILLGPSNGNMCDSCDIKELCIIEGRYNNCIDIIESNKEKEED